MVNEIRRRFQIRVLLEQRVEQLRYLAAAWQTIVATLVVVRQRTLFAEFLDALVGAYPTAAANDGEQLRTAYETFGQAAAGLERVLWHFPVSLSRILRRPKRIKLFAPAQAFGELQRIWLDVPEDVSGRLALLAELGDLFRTSLLSFDVGASGPFEHTCRMLQALHASLAHKLAGREAPARERIEAAANLLARIPFAVENVVRVRCAGA